MSDILQIEQLLAEMLLCEFSDMEVASTLSQDQQTLKDQSRVPLSKRVRDSAQQLRNDVRSDDPLIRKKVMLQRQLAQVIAQIKKRQQEQQNQSITLGGI